MNLLSTIRVPKNLLYLTDRLPKPNYDTEDQKRKDQAEMLKRKTFEAGGRGSAMLPDIES